MRWSTLCPTISIKLMAQYIDTKRTNKSIYCVMADLKERNGRHVLGTTVNKIRRESSGKSNMSNSGMNSGAENKCNLFDFLL